MKTGTKQTTGNLKDMQAGEEGSRAGDNSGQKGAETGTQMSGGAKKEEREKIFPAENDDAGEGGGDGYKKVGEVSSSRRWGQEWLSGEDIGQHPEKLRSPSERQLSGYDDNTTTVGQPGNRKNLGGAENRDNSARAKPDSEGSSKPFKGGTQEGINKESAGPTGFGVEKNG